MPNTETAHPHIVDIGLLGAKVKDKDGQTVTGFELILGGNLEGNQSTFGEKTGIKMTPEKVNSVVENIITAYIASGQTNINNYLKEKVSNEEFISALL